MCRQALLALVVLVLGAECRDETVGDGVMTLRVLGRSGKIELCQKENVTAKRREKCLTLEFDDLSEINSAGEEVSCKGHFFRNFAKTDFTFTRQVEKKFHNLSVTYFGFVAKLQNETSKFTVEVFMFKEDGAYTVGNETINVLKGDVKMNLEVKDWVFCGDGPGEDKPTAANPKKGDMLRVRIAVKAKVKGKTEKAPKRLPKNRGDGEEDGPGAGKGGKPDGGDNQSEGDKKPKGSGGETKKPDTQPSGTKGRKRQANRGSTDFDFEEGTILSTSREYMLKRDNSSEMTTETMQEDYPKLGSRGKTYFVEFVFAKGQSFKYDPTMQVADSDPESVYDDEEDDNDPNGVSTATTSLGLLSACLWAVYRVL